MKLKHLIVGMITAAVFSAGSAITIFAAQTQAQIQAVTDSQITGWAYDESQPETPASLSVQIVDQASGQEVFRQDIQAGEYRDELKEQGMGNGSHGFVLNMDWSALPAGVYTVNAWTEDAAQPTASCSYQWQGAPQGVSLGIFKTTAYCPCKGCSGSWGRSTSTGAVACANHTIAVDPSVIPYGSRVMINGVIYTAEDRGGAVKGNHIDIFFDSHSETQHYGTRNAEVFLLPA